MNEHSNEVNQNKEANSEFDVYQCIKQKQDKHQHWRRSIHQHPELGFEEHTTSAFVVSKLKEWDIEVVEGIAGTGVVGKLRVGDGQKAIGLRADMDALAMQELNEFSHRSQVDGKFHGCGHDGHTVMLLGAAEYLAQHKNFDGTVYFIFQPAEEGLGGASAMIEEGLFDRFPMDAVYGMHNWPNMQLGKFGITEGPMMAAIATFDIVVKGIGGHGALPHHCIDPIVIAAEIVQALQSIVSRNVNPQRSAVLSVTKIHGGDAYNVIPNEVTLAGGLRFFDQEVGELMKKRMTEVVQGIATLHGAQADIQIQQLFPVLVNSPKETINAFEAATLVVGNDYVDLGIEPVSGSEDFAHMLEKKPGAYIFIGNGEGEGGCMVHHPEYDFNDNAIAYGASYWVKLTESQLK